MVKNMDETLLSTKYVEEYQILQILGLFKYGSEPFIWYLFNRFNLLCENELIHEKDIDKFNEAFVLDKKNSKTFSNTISFPEEVKQNINDIILNNDLKTSYDKIIDTINKEIQFVTIKYPTKIVFPKNNVSNQITSIFQGIGLGLKKMKIWNTGNYEVQNYPYLSSADLIFLLNKSINFNYLQINGPYIELTENGNNYVSILTALYNNYDLFDITSYLITYYTMQTFIQIPFVNRMFHILNNKEYADFYDIAEEFGSQNTFDFHFVSKRLQTYVFQNESNKVFTISARTFMRKSDMIINNTLNIMQSIGWINCKEMRYEYAYCGITYTNDHDKKYYLTEQGKEICQKAECTTQYLPIATQIYSNKEDKEIYLKLRGYAILYILYINNDGATMEMISDGLLKLGYENIGPWVIAYELDNLIRVGFHVKRDGCLYYLTDTIFDKQYFLDTLNLYKKKHTLLIDNFPVQKRKESICRNFIFLDKKFLVLMDLAYLNKTTFRKINERNYLLKVLLCEALNRSGINAECFFENNEPDICVEFDGYRILIDISTCRDDKDIELDIDKIVSLYKNTKSQWAKCFDFKKETIIICITSDLPRLREKNVLAKIKDGISQSGKKIYCASLLSIEDLT